MPSSSSRCLVCDCSELRPGTAGYLRCDRCGHETRSGNEEQSLMVNEALVIDRMTKPDLKDRFQIRVALAAACGRHRIIDVGAGSGRFLFHIRRHFAEHLGIEITKECLDFGRSRLRLDLAPSLSAENIGSPDVVTFWHSMEHMPAEAITNTLSILGDVTRVVISVPNASNLYGARSVYYDPANHVHQFSAASLDLLMARFGFHHIRSHTSIAYSWLGHALSILNLVSPHNFLYLSLRRDDRKKPFAKRMAIALCAAGALLALILALPIFLVELLAPRRGIVITAVYEQRIAMM